MTVAFGSFSGAPHTNSSLDPALRVPALWKDDEPAVSRTALRAERLERLERAWQRAEEERQAHFARQAKAKQPPTKEPPESRGSSKALSAAGRSLQQLRSGSPRSPSPAAQASPQSPGSALLGRGHGRVSATSSLAYLPSSLASHQPWVPQLVGMHAREALYLPRTRGMARVRTWYEDEDGALHCGEPCWTEPNVAALQAQAKHMPSQPSNPPGQPSDQTPQPGGHQ